MVTPSYSPPKVDRIWLWVYYNKIPIYPIFYSIYLRGTIELREPKASTGYPGNPAFDEPRFLAGLPCDICYLSRLEGNPSSSATAFTCSPKKATSNPEHYTLLAAQMPLIAR